MAELLICADDLDTVHKKGYVITVQETPYEWGDMEGLPNFIQLTISDATKAQVEAYMQQWPIRYQFSLVNQNQDGYRVQIAVDPLYIDASNVARDQIKANMREYIENAPEGDIWHGTQIVNFAPSAMTVDIPKPANLAAMADDFHDKFAEILDIRRYYFSPATVDAAIVAGGVFTRTKAQVLTIIQDKLAV